MGKTRKPTSQKTSDPTVLDQDASQQKAPRKYRIIQNLIHQKAKAKEQRIKKSPKPIKTIDESLNDLRKVVNQTAKRQTKKYEKRKDFLVRKQLKNSKSTDEGILLTDTIKFGERVEAPPKITILPKKKGYIKAAPVPTTNKKDLKLVEKTDMIRVGRKQKLKTLAGADRQSILMERERLINYYRSKKSNPALSK